ncbi:ExbD/TolR family protein [Pseudomonas sp. ABC1]|uniref:ExbD/TolR family protein n=1 Tax=Pseudomonas sp. ABC1 TaxID=2748080 RepID=UPI0015C38D55|nr:ExbD/TolR family protein [Pseudomonas sp. ABC1]QLF93578.1 ExbD/TolR family protein [Pseudomonas sp. ABC1]
MLVRSPRKHAPKAEMNVVPYIDVMLVLLVIFMVTAPMLVQGVSLELPKVAAEALPSPGEQQLVTLSVTAEGDYYWNVGPELAVGSQSDQAVDLDAMRDSLLALVAERADTQVYVRADQGADYAAVLAGIAALQRGGISRIGLVTEAPQP